ncbi:hypothetical protein [Armatimonas rosea]|uniref:IrrE N-terminal-like domain-containing protein n=1 Tax=Armatimonas rosea TaxID=685828 RepID=A0A7W9SQN0_ARMRO|nr:hypothetical protein [Armatimonas rosea]MBB6050423.1 hypothetical protein [Armatimonas rosea]
MPDAFSQTLVLATRLREELGMVPTEVFDPIAVLESAYPVACVAIPSLCVGAIRQWLEQRVESFPAQLLLAEQEDRPLHGAVLAWRGVGLLLADEHDPWIEQRYTYAHEGAHFLLEHYFPRQEALRCLGERIRPVLNGERPPTLEERSDALLRNTALAWHAHLFPKDAQGRQFAEERADWLACGLLVPPEVILQGEQKQVSADEVADTYQIPLAIAKEYVLRLSYEQRPKNNCVLLERLASYNHI